MVILCLTCPESHTWLVGLNKELNELTDFNTCWHL